MINITIVTAVLFIHWVADFLCQTDKMAQGKSKNWTDLLSHTGVYSFIWFFGAILIFSEYHKTPYYGFSFNIYTVLLFTLITFICHTITDYFTSRLNSKLWEEKKVHWFFVSVGWDQFLHFTQLLLTYYLLIKL